MQPATRRQLLKAAWGATALVALQRHTNWLPRAAAQSTDVQVHSLGEALHVLSVAGVNVVAQTSPGGCVLVDGGPRDPSSMLLEAVAALPGAGPVEVLFNTHWHPEQTGSNEPLAAAGATIIAQENTRLWLSSDITYPWDGTTFEALPEAARPTLTFYDDGGELDSGVRYGHLRHAAHTDGAGDRHGTWTRNTFVRPVRASI